MATVTDRRRRPTRVWTAAEPLPDLNLDRLNAITDAAVVGIEERGGLVVGVTVAPLATPLGCFAFVTVTYRDPLPARRG